VAENRRDVQLKIFSLERKGVIFLLSTFVDKEDWTLDDAASHYLNLCKRALTLMEERNIGWNITGYRGKDKQPKATLSPKESILIELR